ncbi:MAG: LacI family DNA-binding transcriptional regulator [Lentisphaeria bacterium]|nr:LacI family DNA-binding transcriptional regulator [Lentisphaeria bacterium]
MPVTQKDIAKAAGVDQSTVSRILRNDPRAEKISEKVRLLVLETAKKMKYSFNVSAVTMRGQINRSTVALICSAKEHVGASYHIFLFSLIRQLNEHSYGVRIYSSGDYESIFREIAANQIYYVICSQNTEENFLRLGKLCLQYKVKAIFNCAKQYFPEIPVFADDNETNVRMMIRHLYEKGHRRIGFVAGGASNRTADQRIAACRKEMAALDLDCPEESFYREVYSVPSFHQYLKRWQGTALCCLDNGIASLAESALLYAGFKIPGDISIISYGHGLSDPGHYPRMSHISTGVQNNFSVIQKYLFTDGTETHASDYTTFLPGTLVEGDTVAVPGNTDLSGKFATL